MDYLNFENKYFDADLALEQPITAAPIPEREGAPGTDIGGGLTSKIVGITSNPTQNQVQALQASIRGGASKIELGFMGVNKGSGQAPTPESMSKIDREMINQLARINEVETTVHAAPQVSNLSGLDQRGGGFSENARETALNEIKRAIDFAADASTGGAVVFHWDEWQRPIESAYGLDDENNQFQGHKGEYKSEKSKSGYGSETVMFVDTETDRIQSIRRDMDFVEPEIQNIELKTDERGNRFLEYRYVDDENSGEAKTKPLYYDDIIKLEEEMNNPQNEKYKDYVAFAEDVFPELRNKWKDIEAMPEKTELQRKQKNDEKFLFHFMRRQADQAYEQYLSADSYYRHYEPTYERDSRSKAENDQRRKMAWARFQEQLDKVNKLRPVEEYSTEKAAETVAEAAMYAWERSQNNPNIKRNLYVAPESVFPESYGSHPDEMRAMIDKARDEMTEQLMRTQKFKDEKKAHEEAEKYIRATFDIGHLNMWRRHLKRKEGESLDDYNQRFNKWALDKSTELAKEGYIGHAHMSDNFGFGDEHLSVGQGNAPIREFVDAMRKTGKVDDFIVELGSYNAETALKDAWSHLGVSFGKGRYFAGSKFGAPNYFNQAQFSYSRSRKPSYVYGKYVPEIKSEKWQGWAPWSGSPI
jgi:hypothetical protein